jgi:hypothetical protein
MLPIKNMEIMENSGFSRHEDIFTLICFKKDFF